MTNDTHKDSPTGHKKTSHSKSKTSAADKAVPALFNTLTLLSLSSSQRRYSTCAPQAYWASYEKSKHYSKNFIEDQKSLLSKIQQTLKHKDTDIEKLCELVSEYTSHTFDFMGYSISTEGLQGLTKRAHGTNTHSPFEQTIKDAYNAEYARVSTNGGSNSVIMTMQTARRARPDKTLILTCGSEHTSLQGGALAAGLSVKKISSHIESQSGLASLNYQKDLHRQLIKHHKECLAVFLTLPTYTGASFDLKETYSLCQKLGVYLIIDAAWGTLWGLHPNFPDCQIKHCDMMCISLHKLGLGPCQVCTVLFNQEDLVRAYDELANIGFITTSPNHLMLAVSESRLIKICNGERDAAWQDAIEACTNITNRLKEIHPQLEAINLAKHGAEFVSPNILTIETSQTNVDANAWAKALSAKFNRDCELSSSETISFIFSPGNCLEIDGFLADLKKSFSSVLGSRVSLIASSGLQKTQHHNSYNIRDSFFAPTKLIPLEKAVGFIASSHGTITPPCRTIWGYGEPITVSIISTVSEALKAGKTVQGIEYSEGKTCIRVMDTNSRLHIETIQTPLKNATLTEDMADLFIGGWAAPPYCHAIIHEDYPNDPLSPAAYLNAIEKTDSHVEQEWYTAAEVINLPLKSGYHHIVDRDLYIQLLTTRMRDTGYLTLVRDEGGQLVGILHCRSDISANHAAETEEWLYAHMLCDTLPETKGSKTRLLEKLEYHFGITAKHRINSISAQILHPDYRGTHVFYDMMKSLIDTISPKHARLPLVCELSDEGSTARIFNEAVMDKVVYDVLPRENGHCVGYSERLSNAFFYYMGNKNHWRYVIQEQAKKIKRPFYPHPEDHPNIKVKLTENGKGFGVYACANGIKAGETVARFVGETYFSENATDLHPIMVDHAIQVSENTYVFGQYGLAHLINSSHSPNLGILDTTALVALRDIQTGEELVWNYEMSEDSNWQFSPCLCGAKDCPGFIGSFSDLPEKVQQSYIDQKIASDWLLKNMKK